MREVNQGGALRLSDALVATRFRASRRRRARGFRMPARNCAFHRIDFFGTCT